MEGVILARKRRARSGLGPYGLGSARFPLILFFVTLFVVFFFREAAGAETREKRKLVLNLEQMIEKALAVSPELGESRSDKAVAESDLRQVEGAYYPQIETHAVVGPVNEAELPEIRNNQIYDPSPGTSLSTTGIFGRLDLRLTQPLYTFGKLSNRKEAASRGVKAAELETRKKENEIALRVSQLYFALVLARGGVDAAKEADGFFEDARRLVNRLLKLKSPNVAESDLYRIDAFRASALRSQAEAEKGKRVAYFGLKSMLRLPPEVELDVRDEYLAMREQELADLESYISKALSSRPEVKQLKEAIEAQKYQVEAARSDRYPSFFLALEASFAGAPNRETLYNAYIPDEFNHAYAGVVAGVKWDLDFGISSAKVEKGLAEYRKLLFSQDTAEMNIPIQVVKSYQEVLEWKESAKAYRKAAIASRKWVVTALGDFNMGIGTADDLLKAIDKYGENQGNYIEALFNYNVSLSELKFAVGERDWQRDGD
jgi:outer membrane protein